MHGLVNWATSRARMIIAFVALSIGAGVLAYVGLPKEGEPDIDVPALFVSVPFPGISAEDSEKLLVKPLEAELRDVDGLDKMTSTASEGYAIVVLEFEFGWDKEATLAEVRDRANRAEAEFPDGVEQYTIDEINFSEFPILVVSLSGDVPERTLNRVAKDLQSEIESLRPVLEAGLAGHRDEMVEVLIDPLKLESYNVTAGELLQAVTNNNQLVAAGEVEAGTGAYSVKIPSSFDEPGDIYDLPIKVNGDRVVTLGELAEIRLTFEDAVGTARYNGEPTVALQIVKRKGENLIDTVNLVKEMTGDVVAGWPEELRSAVTVSYSMDDSARVAGMVGQLEGAVLTAIALVMIVVLAALGIRSALLVGFAIPTSFLLCFALLAVMGMTISNIVMFGLILAVGMLVDGAIVVVEYADKRIAAGQGPMRSFGEAAKRMFWPIVSSTATTLCAFLPMLFWPGMPGEFMGNLPVTLIFVLSASLVVALIYLPVLGGIAGRISAILERASASLANNVNTFVRIVGLLVAAAIVAFAFLALTGGQLPAPAAAALFLFGTMTLSVFGASLKRRGLAPVERAGYRRSWFGHAIHAIVGNPIMPFVAIGLAVFAMVSTFSYFGENSKGVEFFVVTEPERGVVYVRARGNLSLDEKDRMVRAVERQVMTVNGVQSVFSFAGSGGLNQNRNGSGSPLDEVGRVQFELAPWDEREKGKLLLEKINEAVARVPGIIAEVAEQRQGPASGKPVHLRLRAANWEALHSSAERVRAQMESTPGLIEVEDNRPLPGIDWEIQVDVAKAGRYGADVLTVGAMVQLVTRGILLDTMRTETSDEEVEIRVRYPEADRILSTLDTMKVRTSDGLVPLSNFITRTPVPKLGQITRFDAERYFDVKANVDVSMYKLTAPIGDGTDAEAVEVLAYLRMLEGEATAAEDITVGEDRFTVLSLTDAAQGKSSLDLSEVEGIAVAQLNANERIDALTEWLNADALPADVDWAWTGDREEQEESQAFLGQAFLGALGLMFVILLAQFNSFYNSALVLMAVVMSVTGVLIGMLVMDQTFSIIMTGTGIVALAGIVVNNNIVLIDTYQEFVRQMPRIEAIVRTAEARIRPVLLTTITTMAGLTPMMFGISVDFYNGGYTIDAPTALWWKQLATAVVFGLGTATVLTLVVTPAALGARHWVSVGGGWLFALINREKGTILRDRRVLTLGLGKHSDSEVVWEGSEPVIIAPSRQLDAAE